MREAFDAREEVLGFGRVLVVKAKQPLNYYLDKLWSKEARI